MKQHRADGVSLVFGLIFLIIAAWWTIGWFTNFELNIPNGGWVLAFALIVIGLLGIVGSLRGNGSSQQELTEPAAPAAVPTAAAAREDDTAVDGLPPVSDKDD